MMNERTKERTSVLLLLSCCTSHAGNNDDGMILLESSTCANSLLHPTLFVMLFAFSNKWNGIGCLYSWLCPGHFLFKYFHARDDTTSGGSLQLGLEFYYETAAGAAATG